MDFTEIVWFNWNGGSMLMYFIVSLGLWALCQTKDIRETKVNGELLGTAASLIAWFDVGLYCLVVLALFHLVVWNIKLYTTNLLRRKAVGKA